jgi:uncharacterized membrane protein YadS
MTLISSTKLAESLNGRANARLPCTIQRWTRRLPRLFLNSVIEGAPFAIRQLPGMATFSPMMLTMVIGIALHNIVVAAAWAKQGVTSSLRWLPRIASFPLGLQFTSSQTIETGGVGLLGIVVATVRASFAVTIWIGELLGVEPTLAQLIAAGTSICGASAVITTNTHDEDVAYAIACVTVFGSVAMSAYPIPADAKAWIIAGTTFLQSIALAAGLETNIGKLRAKGFRPALLAALPSCLSRASASR